MMTDGETRFVSPESVSTLRAGGRVREAFQSYPALLVDDGRVPDLLRNPGRLVDLGHRDTRFVMCALGDGALIVALTRFDNLGRVFGGLPIGLTLDETAALMGALGCRQAVSLDGGLSAQLLVRPEEGPVRRWEGMRKVPLGIEVLPRQ
jgi:exopolysaccharide biosynthesis protein